MRDVLPLVQAVGRGDAGALDQLYRLEAGAVYRYALALSGDAARAADVTQDAFIVLATQPQGFDPARGSLGAWLAGAARHALLAHWREAGRHEALDDDTLEQHRHPDAAASPEQLLVQRQDLARLYQALQGLPWAFREAVVLVDLQERPYADAARIAGCELNTLRTRVHRGRARLAALLADGPGETP